jgi:hypothetical protein
MHPKIKDWIAARPEAACINKLEEEADQAWFDPLDLEQREAFAELMDSHHGLHHLREKLAKARWESRRGEEEKK